MRGKERSKEVKSDYARNGPARERHLDEQEGNVFPMYFLLASFSLVSFKTCKHELHKGPLLQLVLFYQQTWSRQTSSVSLLVGLECLENGQPAENLCLTQRNDMKPTRVRRSTLSKHLTPERILALIDT